MYNTKSLTNYLEDLGRYPNILIKHPIGCQFDFYVYLGYQFFNIFLKIKYKSTSLTLTTLRISENKPICTEISQ